jgi:3-oxoacyl-[acyl-carrier protein] reductase
MGRIGTFEDAGGCALFLASNLSSFVTGTTLHPDGGALASAGWFNWPTEGFLNHPPHTVLARLVEDQ